MKVKYICHGLYTILKIPYKSKYICLRDQVTIDLFVTASISPLMCACLIDDRNRQILEIDREIDTEVQNEMIEWNVNISLITTLVNLFKFLWLSLVRTAV